MIWLTKAVVVWLAVAAAFAALWAYAFWRGPE